MVNEKLTWKEFKKLLTDKYNSSELTLGSNKVDNTDFNNYHTNWDGTKKDLLEYIRTVRTKDATEVFLYQKSDHDYFYTVWNSLEGFLFQK